MKKVIFTTTIALMAFHLQAQWTETSDNHSTGKLGIGTSTPSKDIHISRANALAGIDVYNTDVTGRSTILVGQGSGGRYLYMGYLNPSYATTLGAFQPASGVLYTGAPNGMRLISSNYISLTAGGLQGGHERLRISASGYIGIGTSSPSVKLHVSSADEDVTLFNGSNTTGLLADRFNRVILRNLNGQQSWIGIEGSGSNARGYLGIEHWQDASPKIAMTWDKDGKVGIGTTTPDSDALLTVKGSIHSTEIKVLANAGVPDYVFEEDYSLKTLEETKEFILENKHLPEIPSAAEIDNNGGFNVGEMNMMLLKKIEELTLHLIKQNERMGKMEIELNVLKN